MSDVNGSPAQKDESDRSGPGSPEIEHLKQFKKQAQEEKRELQTALRKKAQRLDEQEILNNQLEGELARANQAKEAAIKEAQEVISSRPTMTFKEKEEVAYLRKTVDLLESQASGHEATLAESIKLESKVRQLQIQLDKAKDEIENQKEWVEHEKKTSRDHQKELAVAKRKTPELHKKYTSLSDAYERQREVLDEEEKRFQKKIEALQNKYDVQVERNKALDEGKKKAEILNANLETQVHTLTGSLKEAEAKLEQSQQDGLDIANYQQAQATRESSPSNIGGGWEELGQALANALDDVSPPQGSVSSIEDEAPDWTAKALEELQQTATSLETDNTKLRGEAAGLKEDVSVLTEERDRLRGKVFKLQEESNGLQKQKEGLAEEKKGLQTTASALEHSNKKLLDEVADLSVENDGLQKKASELTNNTGKLESELHEENDRLQKQISQLQEENAGLQKNASELSSEAGKLKSEPKAGNELQKQVTDLQAENDRLRESADELADDMRKLHAQSRAEKEKLRGEVSALQKQNEELRDKASSLTSGTRKLKDELAETIEALATAKEDQCRFQKLQEERNEAQRDLAAANDYLETEREQAREGAKQHQATMDKLDGEKRNMQEQMAKSQELESQRGALQEERDSLQRELQKELHAKKKALEELEAVRQQLAETSPGEDSQKLRDRLQELQNEQEREDARRETPAGEPALAAAEEGGEEPNPKLAQLQRELAEHERTQARQEAELARQREKKRQEKGKNRVRKRLETIPDESDPDEDGGGGGGGESSEKPDRKRRRELTTGRRIRELERANETLDTLGRNLLEDTKLKKEQIKQLKDLVKTQPLPVGPPPPDDVLALPRADLPGRVRARNQSFRRAFTAALRDLRALLASNGGIQLQTVVTQPKTVLFILYAVIFALLGMIVAEGHRYHHWAVANDVSRAMYVNRNWYVAIVLPDLHPWEQWLDLVNEFR